MVINTNLIAFLADNAHWIVRPPIGGSTAAINTLFNSQSNNSPLEWQEFKQQINEIMDIDPCALELKDGKVRFINELNLNILIEKISVSTVPSTKKKSERTDKRQRGKKKNQEQMQQQLSKLDPTSMLHKLGDILGDMEPPRLTKLRLLLNHESTAHKLTMERISKTTPKVPFLETCNDAAHSQYLAFNTDPSKLPKELLNCVSQKIHFIPIIKPHTDISLGDCSYLDTCHKLDSCRYLHYKKHIPMQALERSIQDCDSFNAEIPYWEMISPWCRNGSTSNLSRDILPPQWINCDVRTFDFKIVGKFAAVIADPAWNIHMNLPYGTCNDTELLNLPLHTVQDEGILLLWVTGRAIEIGKASLTKWGYAIKNEVVWIKTNQLGRTICTGRTGHWLNHSKEHLLVGVKGKPEWLDKLVDLDFLVSATRETSRKPDELYGMVERLVGPHARKLEIFGRDHNARPGWFTIGNQLNGAQIHECDVLERYQKSLKLH